MTEAERIWTRARDLYGDVRDRRYPSRGVTELVLALRDHGPAHGCELARTAGVDQGNATRWLLKLHYFRLIEVQDEVAGLGHQGGGRPALVWELTRTGRELAEALRRELASAGT